MFKECSSLTSINLSSFDTSKVTTMGSMFESCSSLMSLDLSSFKTPLLENIYYMLSGVISLDTLNLKNFTADSIKYNISNALGSGNINKLYLNNWDIANQDILKRSSATYGTIYVNKKYESYLKSEHRDKNFVFVE